MTIHEIEESFPGFVDQPAYMIQLTLSFCASYLLSRGMENEMTTSVLQVLVYCIHHP